MTLETQYKRYQKGDNPFKIEVGLDFDMWRKALAKSLLMPLVEMLTAKKNTKRG